MRCRDLRVCQRRGSEAVISDAAKPAPNCLHNWRKGLSVTPAMGAKTTAGSIGMEPMSMLRIVAARFLQDGWRRMDDAGVHGEDMRRALPGLLLWFAGGIAMAAPPLTAPLTAPQMRTLSTSNPRELITDVRAALDAGLYVNDPAGEREALWWMGHAGVNVSDAAVVTEAVARLKSLGSVGHDTLAESYAGFLS